MNEPEPNEAAPSGVEQGLLLAGDVTPVVLPPAERTMSPLEKALHDYYEQQHKLHPVDYEYE